MRITALQFARALHRYTSPSSSSYDAGFTQQLRRLRPDWSRHLVVMKKKKALLALAHSGKERPPSRSSLGVALMNYVTKKNACHDPALAAELRRIRPDWFAPQAASNKTELLKRANAGKPKPRHVDGGDDGKLADMLWCYTTPSHRCYDASFTASLYEKRPDWRPRQWARSAAGR